MRVLLVHGMGRSPLSLGLLARVLRRDGHQIERVGYIAALESFASIRSRVRRRLEALARRGERYAVLGHSLGGLTLRSALIDLAPAPVRLIMLATPNQSPQLARRLQRFWPYRLLTGETGQLLASDKFFRQLPPPLVPYIIIAGSAGPRGRWSPFHNEVNDWLVAVEETKLVPGDTPIILPVGHTFMMNDPQVQLVVRQALAHVP